MSFAVPVPEEARRREVRYPVTLDARVVVATGDVCLAAKAAIKNLSINGACIHIPVLRKGRVPGPADGEQTCWIVCQLPGRQALSLFSGDIAWMNIRVCCPQPNACFGVRLTNTPPTERQSLELFLSRTVREDRLLGFNRGSREKG